MTNFLEVTPRSASVRARALTGVALSAVTLAMVAQGQASAQQAADIQEITITGSRIKAPNLTSDSPVTAVTQEEIKQSNVQAVENLLNNLPSVFADFTSTQSSLVGSTIATVNLRGLGATRTLVLIDGRRIGPGDPQNATGAAADLNFIPTNLVKGVDVLTGGAAAIYGSDAVAGVVNFHLMRDFQGAQLDFSYSAAQHSNNNSEAKTIRANTTYAVQPAPSSNFDGFIRESSGMVGANSSDNKGNVTMYADYRQTTPIQNSARDWAGCPVSVTTTNNVAYKYCAGSSTNPHGTFRLKTIYDSQGNVVVNPLSVPSKLSNNPDGSATFVKGVSAFLFNYNGTAYLQRQDDRASLGALAHYELNPHVDLYTEMMYMNDSSQQQDGAGGLFGGGVTGVQTTLTIPCNNKYLGTAAGPLGYSQYTAIGCAPGVATAAITFPGLRFTQPRQDIITHDDYRALAGIRGDIDGNWSYDASASHWQSIYALKNSNWTLLPAVNSAIANGTLNIFQYGGDTLAQQQAVSGTELQTGNNKEDDVTVSFSGDLGPYGGKSPFAKNPIAVAAGAEYRHTTLTLDPDANFQAGYVLGGAKVLPISGGEKSIEEFAEVRVPIIEDISYVKALDLDLALRHSDYTVDNSNSAFSTNTYKISSDYAPMDDFRLRAGYNRAARAPNVYELFQPNTFGSTAGNDPCAGNASTGALPSAAFRNACLNAPGLAKVTAQQFDLGLVNACTASQCNGLVGGNIALKPEIANTWTWGVNITPTMIKGLAMSVDYWDVKVNNYIQTGGYNSSAIITGCYSGQTYYCQFIHRDPGTGSIGSGNGYLSQTTFNFDQLHNSGIDIDLSYTRKIEDLGLGVGDYGALSFRMNGTYNLTAVTQAIDTTPAYDCAGYFGYTCNTPTPKWRHQARLTWTTPWDADVSLNWRYIEGTKLDANDVKNATAYGYNTSYCGTTACNVIDSSIPNYNYIDLSASYRLWEKYTFRVGVNNLFDKDPPIINNGFGIAGTQGGENGNTYTMYDVLGRVIFMSFSAKW